MRRLPENKKQYELEKKHVSPFGQIADNPTTSQLIQMLERLNAKSSNLLQHVSIITAIASVFFISATPEDNPKNEIFRSIIIGEICLYLTVALRCLYVAWMTGSTDIAGRNKDQYEEHIFKIDYKRRKTYKMCLRLAVFVTLAFICTILWRFTA